MKIRKETEHTCVELEILQNENNIYFLKSKRISKVDGTPLTTQYIFGEEEGFENGFRTKADVQQFLSEERSRLWALAYLENEQIEHDSTYSEMFKKSKIDLRDHFPSTREMNMLRKELAIIWNYFSSVFAYEEKDEKNQINGRD